MEKKLKAILDINKHEQDGKQT